MSPKKFTDFRAKCPYEDCEKRRIALDRPALGPSSKQVIAKGFFFRSSDRKRVHRFRCLLCERSFSEATLDACFFQKKRQINQRVEELLYSGVSQRRSAKLLKLDRKTIVRKMIFLGAQAELERKAWLEVRLASGKIVHALQFDEMESFERSKCLPLSLLLAVEQGSRKILGFRVCSMPAKGPLASISRKKYGPRADQRAQAAHSLFSEIKEVVAPKATLTTDQNPKYPAWIRPHFPKVTHVAVKGRDGCVVGQGELKKVGFDPIFDLNHTAAMFRANVNRLFRRTWCTTKRPDRLEAHLAIYVRYHNAVLTAE